MITHPGTPPSERPDHELRKFPPKKVHAPVGNRVHDGAKLQRLFASIQTFGQLVPGQVCDHPDKPGEFLCLSGVGRNWCCDQQGIDFLAQYLSGFHSPDEVIAKRLTEDQIREAMSPPDLAADFNRLMKLWDCSAATLSKRLNIPESTISRVRSIKRLAPDLLPLVEDFTLCPSIAYIIAGVPSLESQRKLAREAIDGELTRDQVSLRSKSMRGDKRGPKPKKLTGKLDGREITISLKDGDTTEALMKAFIAKIKAMRKFRDSPPENLGFLFG